MTTRIVLLLLMAVSVAHTRQRSQFTRYRSWNTRMYPFWRDGDARFRNCWRGGNVTFDLKNDGPTLTGAKSTFSINLNFPSNQTVLADGTVVWAQNCTVDGRQYEAGQPVYTDPQGTGLFPDGTPITAQRRPPRYVYVWKTWGRFWQVADGPSSSLSIGTENIPMGSYNMELVIYHQRGKDAFIPLGYASSMFTITDQVPFTISMSQVNDLNAADQSFIQNRAVAFSVNLHDPSQYLSASDLTFTWDFGDETGTLISKERTVTHTYLTVGAFRPQVILMASIPTCGVPTAVVPVDSSVAPAVVVVVSPAAVPDADAPVVDTAVVPETDAAVETGDDAAAGVDEGAVNTETDDAAADATADAAADANADTATVEAAAEEPAADDTTIDAAAEAVPADAEAAAADAEVATEEAAADATDAAATVETVDTAVVADAEAAEGDVATEETAPDAEDAAAADATEAAVEAAPAADADAADAAETEAAVAEATEAAVAEATEAAVVAATEAAVVEAAEAAVVAATEAAVVVATEAPVDNVVVAAVTEAPAVEEVAPAADTEAEVVEADNEVAATVAAAEQPAEAEAEAEVPLVIAKRQAPDCTVYRYGSLATSLDVVQGIESVEIVQVSNVVSLATELEQNAVDVTVSCQGSLPREVCTVVSDADCVTPVETVCSAAVPTPDCQLVLRQFFNETGVFCLNVSLTNDVSLAVTSARVNVNLATTGSPAGTAATVLGVMVLACVVCCVGLMYRRLKQYQPLVEESGSSSVRSSVTSVPLLLWNLLSRQSPGESRPLLQGRIV